MSFIKFKDLSKTKGQNIIFTHVATGKSVEFPGFMTDYGDQYAINWDQQQIFGRNDPIKPFQSTTRSINFAFTILSHSHEDAVENLEKIQLLIRMMYPMYSAPLSGKGGSFGRTIKAPPLLRVKFANMIKSVDGDGGLLSCVEGFTYAPNKDSGYFIGKNGDIFPKQVDTTWRISPQHESPLGWDAETSEFISNTFPYSVTSDATNRDDAPGKNGALENANEDKIMS